MRFGCFGFRFVSTKFPFPFYWQIGIVYGSLDEFKIKLDIFGCRRRSASSFILYHFIFVCTTHTAEHVYSSAFPFFSFGWKVAATAPDLIKIQSAYTFCFVFISFHGKSLWSTFHHINALTTNGRTVGRFGSFRLCLHFHIKSHKGSMRLFAHVLCICVYTHGHCTHLA